jgi:histidyl-tRNA synthetase
MLSLYDNVFSKLKMDGVSIKINHRKILAGIVGFLGVESKLTSFTLTLDKLNKIGKEGVLKELQANDFSENALDTIEKLLEIKGSASEQLNTLEKLLVNQDDGLEGINELKFILSQLESSPLESVGLDFDITLARGLHYYTGMIVEVSAPETVKMGSIGGGGRYDDLTGKFGLKNMSGIGVSFGFERIYLVMEALELFPETLQTSANILFANFGDASTAIAYKHMNKLRSHGIACELYPNEVKLKKQLAYANDKKIARVILIGSQEIEKKEFVLKDMDTGIQISHPVKELLSLLIS